MMLSGLRVLDLSRLLPGPFATLVLAELGAQVDKLEPPDGDLTRQMPPMKSDQSALFATLNRNKRSLVLDLKRPDGVAAFKRLVRRYDVLVETFRPETMHKLGVGYEVLKLENPAIIYCAISGYGATGPDRLKAGHDINYVSRAGLTGYSGTVDGPPVQPSATVADIGGSLFSVAGILAALYERERTKIGRFVDISLTESALAFLHVQLGARLLMAGQGDPIARGREALNGGLPSYGLYQTQDGKWLSVGALEPNFFHRLCAALGRLDLLEGAYDLGAGTRHARRELDAIFASKTQAEWLAFLGPHDVCVEPVHEGDEVFSDPQLVARGVFDAQHLRLPLGGRDVAVHPARILGADTAQVLSEAGFSEAEVAQLWPL